MFACVGIFVSSKLELLRQINSLPLSIRVSGILLPVPLCIVGSLCSVLLGYLLAGGLFVGNSFIFRLDSERGAGYQTVVSETTQLVYMLLFSAELIFISII